MGTKARYENGLLRYYESTTHETVKVMAPLWYEEDFLGDGTLSTDWTLIDVSSAGDTTPALVADGFSGLLRLKLDSTSEAQESGFTWNDQRPLVLNQGVNIEYRLRINTLPTLVSEVVFGLAADKNAAADSVAVHAWFKADGSGAIVAETDDGTTDNDDKSTGVTLVADEYAVFRIDCTDPTDVKFFINGNRVATGTTFSMNADPDHALQPYVHLAKASGAGLGIVDVDYVKIWQKRS